MCFKFSDHIKQPNPLEWSKELTVGIELKDDSDVQRCKVTLTVEGMKKSPELDLDKQRPVQLKNVPIECMKPLSLANSDRQIVGEVECQCEITGYLPDTSGILGKSTSWTPHEETLNLKFPVKMPVNIWEEEYCASHLSMSNRETGKYSIAGQPRRIKNLLNNISDTRPIIWFYGRPGIGKTHLIENLEKQTIKWNSNKKKRNKNFKKWNINFKKWNINFKKGWNKQIRRIILVSIILKKENNDENQLQSRWKFLNLIDVSIWRALLQQIPKVADQKEFIDWKTYFAEDKTIDFYKFSAYLPLSQKFRGNVLAYLKSIRKTLLLVLDGFYYFLKNTSHSDEIYANVLMLMDWGLQSRYFTETGPHYSVSIIVTDVIEMDVRLKELDASFQWTKYVASRYGKLKEELVNQVKAESPGFLPNNREIKRFLEKSLIERGNLDSTRKTLVDGSKRFFGELSEMLGRAQWLYIKTPRDISKDYNLSAEFVNGLVKHYFLSGFIEDDEQKLLTDLIDQPTYKASIKFWATSYSMRGEEKRPDIVNLSERLIKQKSILNEEGCLYWNILRKKNE